MSLIVAASCGGGGETAPETSETGPAKDGTSGEDAGGGRPIWVGNSDLQQVTAIEPESGEELGKVELSSPPTALAVGDDGAWVATEDGNVARIDPSTYAVSATVAAGSRIGYLALGDGVVWATDDGDGTGEVPPALVRIDPEGPVAERIQVADVNETFDGLAVTGDAVFVLISNALAVAKVDRATNEVVKKTPLGQAGGYGYGGFVVDSDHIWVLDAYSHKLVDVDAESLDVRGTSDADAALTTPIALADARLATGMGDADALALVEPTKPAEPDSVEVGGSPEALLVRDGTLFVALGSDAFGELARVDLADGQKLEGLPGVYADLLGVDKVAENGTIQ